MASSGHGLSFAGASVFQRLSVEDNLIAILETMQLSRAERKDRAEQLIQQFGLLTQRKQLARTLSGGERRKLEIAGRLVHRAQAYHAR